MLDHRLLRADRLIVGFFVQPKTTYPPGPFDRSQAAMVYSKITQKYNYPTFNQLPNGAVMLQPATQSHVQLQELLVQVNEAIEIHIEPTKQKVLDILDIITEYFQLDTFHNMGVKLIARWPVPGDNQASKFLEDKYFKITDTSFGILGPGRLASGMRFRFNRGGSVYDLRIEPQMQDLSKLWIELDVQYPMPFKGLKECGPHIQSTYDYLFSEVSKFLESPV
ncbi:MAG: hypothetical protein WC749_07765 [Dehalococcoidia bacterium]